jgi:hypothetical protein
MTTSSKPDDLYNPHYLERLAIEEVCARIAIDATYERNNPARTYFPTRELKLVPHTKESIQAIPAKKEQAPRKCQIMKERCQAVAGVLWAEDPHLEIKQVVGHPYMKKFGYCGNHTQNYEDRTIHEWIKCMDPRPDDEKKTPFGKNPKKTA